MIRAIINKLSLALLSVLTVAALITTIIFYTPVDPARMSFGQRSDEETIQLFKKKYYLDQPFYVQVWRYFEDLSPLQIITPSDPRMSDYRYTTLFSAYGQLWITKWPYFRKSYHDGRNVISHIAEALPGTMALALASILMSVFLGVAAGLYAGMNQNTTGDRLIMSITTILYAIPSYVSSLLVALIFAFVLGKWTHLPLQGSFWDFNDLGDEQIFVSHLILPALALGLRPVSVITQMTRTSVLDVLGSDYVRTARSKGIGKAKLIRHHILPNSMNPIITTISSWFASLLTGSFFVEYIFNYKGLGLLTISALQHFDIPMITGCCIVTVIIFIIISNLTDLAYTFFDPRVKID
ncbi:MAG: ABC transporter permease [Saprospiraceae bacterium]|mgnify:CR=1 FL=1